MEISVYGMKQTKGEGHSIFPSRYEKVMMVLKFEEQLESCQVDRAGHSSP